MIGQKAVILGNGISMLNFDPELIEPDVYIIGTNRWYERTRVDAVVMVEQYQLRHALNTLDSSIPLWTREPWASQLGIPAIPGTVKNDISGSMAIKLATHLGFKQIGLLGYDSFFANSHEKAVDPPRKVTRHAVPQFWHEVTSAAIYASPAQVMIYENPLDIAWN